MYIKKLEKQVRLMNKAVNEAQSQKTASDKELAQSKKGLQ